MTRRHCSKKARKVTKFRDNYDEAYSWDDHLDDQNAKKKTRKHQRKNPLKDKW